MTERIAQLSTLVNRARTFRRRVTWDTARKGELKEQFAQASLVLTDVRVDLAVSTLKVGMADNRGTAVAGPAHINHIQIVFVDDPIQMHIDEVLPRRRAPMTQQHGLDIPWRQR